MNNTFSLFFLEGSDFVEFSSKRIWTEQEKIELLQRWVLVHSYLYYQMDINVVSDHKYDANSRQLFELKTEYPEAWEKARYTYAMKDFDGSTGFGFVERLREPERVSVTFDVGMLLNRHTARRN